MERSELLKYSRNCLPSKRCTHDTERLREDVFCSMFERHSENLTNEEITAMLIKYHAKPNKNKPKRIKQLFQIFKCSDNKYEFLTELKKMESIRTLDGEDFAGNDSLPTPPYTTTTDHGLADQEIEVETLPAQKGEQGSAEENSFWQESTLQTDIDNDSLPTPPYTTTTDHGLVDHATEVEGGEQSSVREKSLQDESAMQTDLDTETSQYPDFSNMSRQALLDYCRVHFPSVSKQQTLEKLRSTVYSNVFSTLIKGLGDKPMTELFNKYGIKP